MTQIWGELFSFNADWGLWTNGNVIFAFVITQRYNASIPGTANQLTFSRVMNIHEHNVIHLGFLGLCFASLDEVGGMNSHPPADLVNTLCPVASRVNPINLNWFN